MKDIEKLLHDHKGLIEAESRKYAQFVPLNVVTAEAYKLARKAANSYDEKSGLQFSTHLYSQLKKLSRISTKYGPTARLPEKRQFEVSRLNHAESALKDELGREPTIEELSRGTGFNMSTVTHLLQNRKKEVNLNNLAYSPVFIDNPDDEWIHFVYNDLPPRDKIIFEHKTGFGGKAELTNAELATKLDTSVSTINNRVRSISETLVQGMKDHGS